MQRRETENMQADIMVGIGRAEGLGGPGEWQWQGAGSALGHYRKERRAYIYSSRAIHSSRGEKKKQASPSRPPCVARQVSARHVKWAMSIPACSSLFRNPASLPPILNCVCGQMVVTLIYDDDDRHNVRERREEMEG